jgi:hypothetical protein
MPLFYLGAPPALVITTIHVGTDILYFIWLATAYLYSIQLLVFRYAGVRRLRDEQGA